MPSIRAGIYKSKFRSLVSISLLMVMAAVQKANGQEQPGNAWVKVVNGTRPAVVVIETDKAQGSGFLVKSDGTLVTNEHVISGASQIMVKLASGEVYRRAFVLASDASKDIAILRIEGVDLPVIPMGNSSDSKVGEEVILLGAPRGLDQSVSNGLISNIRLTEGGVRVIQTSAPASPGSSGGPLLNAKGEAIGILSFSIVQGQNLNFAISINYARGMLEALALSPTSPQGKVLESTGLADPSREVVGSPKESGGVLLAGYGSPAGSFQYVYLELLNFLAVRSVNVANRPGKFGTVEGDIQSVTFLLDYLSKLGAGSLLYLRVEHGWSNIHRISLQCYDSKGVLLWEEKTSSSTSWASTESGAARAALERLKKKLDSHLGKLGLPLKHSATEPPKP